MTTDTEIKKAVLEEFISNLSKEEYNTFYKRIKADFFFINNLLEKIADSAIAKTRAECEKDGMRMFEVKDADMLREGMKIGETQERHRILKLIDELRTFGFWGEDTDVIRENKSLRNQAIIKFLKTKISEADKI